MNDSSTRQSAPESHEPPDTLARGAGVLGEIALRRRGVETPVYELIVNGVFLMDTAETSTERLLAEVVMTRHSAPRRVLVGGLGLGFTVGALLTDARIERVDVVEIEPLLVEWLRAGLVPPAHSVIGDPRVSIVVGDVADVLTAEVDDTYDAVLLDVDNGPDFLVHDHNAALYGSDDLRSALATLRPGGMLAVWSAAASDSLHARLTALSGNVEDVAVGIEREGRAMTYHVYVCTRPGHAGDRARA